MLSVKNGFGGRWHHVHFWTRMGAGIGNGPVGYAAFHNDYCYECGMRRIQWYDLNGDGSGGAKLMEVHDMPQLIPSPAPGDAPGEPTT